MNVSEYKTNEQKIKPYTKEALENSTKREAKKTTTTIQSTIETMIKRNVERASEHKCIFVIR